VPQASSGLIITETNFEREPSIQERVRRPQKRHRQPPRPTTTQINMSASTEVKPSTKKFGKTERTIPHHSEKAGKWYPAEDAAVSKKVCYSFQLGINEGLLVRIENDYGALEQNWKLGYHNESCGSRHFDIWGIAANIQITRSASPSRPTFPDLLSPPVPFLSSSLVVSVESVLSSSSTSPKVFSSLLVHSKSTVFLFAESILVTLSQLPKRSILQALTRQRSMR